MQKLSARTVRKRLGDERMKEIKREDERCLKYGEKFFDSSDALATCLSSSWGYKVANCNFYSRMVMTAFAFNLRNHWVQRKQFLFKEAVMVVNKTGTGDHVFVLVEGNSGAMFVVDPWIRQVIQLEDVIKLSAFARHPLIVPYPDAKALNSLFSVSYQGTVYYDETYVNENTKWILRRNDSQAIERFVNTYYDSTSKKDNELNMRDIYTYLRGYFPGWQLEYEELFPKSNPQHLEHKKAEKQQL